jgi:YD repeat-containing protein
VGALPQRSNYFTGADPSRWVADVPAFAEVDYAGLYPGVDAHFRSTNGRQLEYDFVVAPGASPSVIRLGWQGLQSVQMDGQGNLLLATAGGTVVQQAPALYQVVNGVRQPVSGQHVLLGGGQAGFQVGAYDHSRPLVIDPAISYSTLLGGSGDDKAYAAAVDAAGNVVVVGATNSMNFPTTTGVIQPGLAGGYDVFVTKLNGQGQGLVFSSYLGGSGDDVAYGVALDLAGNPYVTGYSTSPATGAGSFPNTTTGSYRNTNGGSPNVFVTKLTAAGDGLLYSDLWGGSSAQYGYALAVDTGGSAYVAGVTRSSDYPTTAGAFLTTFTPPAGSDDGFVTKLTPTGGTLAYSTFLHSTYTLDGASDAYGVAVDGQGSAFVTGSTTAAHFPTAGGAFQTAPATGNLASAFVSKFNAAGSGLSYSTYLGGSGSDAGSAIAVDPGDSAYVTGVTTSSNFPTTPGALQTGPQGGKDGFVTKFQAAVATPVYSTYLGGSGDDRGAAIAVDAQGFAWVAGMTASTNFPTTSGAAQTSSGGGNDAFISRLNQGGTALSYSSYLGGTGDDRAQGLALDPAGNAYLAGYTNSTNFPTTTYTYQPGNAGGYDAFAAKVVPGTAAPRITGVSGGVSVAPNEQVTKLQNVTLSGTAPANSAVNVFRRGVGLLTTSPVTADGNGNWSFNYGNITTLAEGTYAFTATATANGSASLPSPDFLVSVDLTAPAITVTALASTASLQPPVRVTASDRNGLPNGTGVTLLVYDGTGNTLLWSGAVTPLTDGVSTFTLPYALTAGNSYVLKAQVNDLAGNQGTSAGRTVQVTSVSNPWVPTAQVLSADPMDGQAREQLGNVHLEHALDLDQSPGTVQGGDPRLVYNSDAVSVRPVVQVSLPSNNTGTFPSTITGTLIWDVGGTPSTTTLSWGTGGAHPGDVLTLAAQAPAAVTQTRRYGWQVQVSTPQGTQSVSGAAYVVTQDSSPFGAGWTFAPVDQLFSVTADGNGPAGVLRAYGGTGEWRFYTQNGSAYTSPPGDNGTLTLSGGTYTYQTADGKKWTFDSSGQETSWASTDGQEKLQYRYTGSLLTGMTAIDGALTTFSYTGGLLSSIATVNGRTITPAYDGTAPGSNLTQVTNPDGGLHTFTYDGGHRVTAETFANLQNEWAYTAAGTLGTFTWGSPTGPGGVANPSTTVLSPAVAQGLAAALPGPAQATSTDPDGHSTVMQLDAQGRPLSQVAADGGVTSWTYSNGFVSTVTDPLGRTTTYQLDGAGYVTQATLADGGTLGYQYQDPNHVLTSYTNERGYSTTYAYDTGIGHLGHLTSMTEGIGSPAPPWFTPPVTRYSWTTNGLLQSMTDPLGHTTSYAYDTQRRLTQTQDGLGDFTTFTYDNNGNPQTTTDARGNVTTTAYDVMGRLTQTTDPLTDVTAMAYNPAGLELTTTDALGRQTSTVYDGFNRGLVAATVEAVGTQAQAGTLTSYDPAGLVSGTRSPDGWWQNNLYGPVGRLRQTTDALGGIKKDLYDLGGQLTATRNELGQWTQRQYNPRGWVTQTVDALGNLSTTAYDRAGNTTAVIDPLTHTKSYQYDPLDRQVVATDALGHSVSTTYDGAGNVSTVTDERSHVTSYAYDAADRRTLTTARRWARRCSAAWPPATTTWVT